MQKKNIHQHSQIKYCVSGAADTAHCGAEAYDLAYALGAEIAGVDGIILTGATTGFPLWSAIGAVEAGGTSIGFSPAASKREHAEIYRLPLDYMDLIVYTGFGYAGRDLILTRSADAIFFGCGRIGTIHEFTVAFEDGKPIGILEGGWEMDETLRTILERSNRPYKDRVVFDSDPARLVKRVRAKVQDIKEKNYMTFTYRPQSSDA
jgi:hypothetical protein